jgi:hypothetical protein
MGPWMKIAWAAALLGMLVYIYPAAKRWMTQGPKAQPGDWGTALLPLALVAAFVALLVMLVR